MSVIIRKGVPYGSGDTSLYSTAPVGTILAFASDTIPDTYLLCDGASLAITDYPELYKVIGTTYGSVDDDHFNVPKYNMGAYDLSDSKYWKDTVNGYNLSNGNLKIIINYNTSTIHVSINAPVITQDRNLLLQITIPETLGIANVKNIRCIWHQSTSNWSQTFSYNSSTHLLYITIDTNRGGSTKQTIYGEFVGDLVFDSSHLFTPIIKYKYTATSTNPLDKTNDDKDYLITTRAEWEAMTTADKAKFDGFLVAFIEDVNAGLIMDSEVVQGSENPVSGNAVYEAIQTVSKKVTDNTTRSRVAITSSYVPSGSLYVARRNGVYTVEGAFALLKNVARDNWIVIATLPSGYYPTNYVYGTITLAELGTFPLDVNPSTGEIRVYIYSKNVPTETDLTGKWTFVALTYIN